MIEHTPLPSPEHISLRILRQVPHSYAWNWRSDIVSELEKRGFVKIEHGGSSWSLTDLGRAALGAKITSGADQPGT